MTRYEVELTDEEARRYVAWWEGGGYHHHADGALGRIADAIRANPPTPPRMAEPRWGEKVRAGTGDAPPRRFVAILDEHGEPVWQDNAGRTYFWADLIGPEPWSADA